jgi:hypothetical protein
MAINPTPTPADIAGSVQQPATNIRIAETPAAPVTPTPVTPAPVTPVTPAKPADYKKYRSIYDVFAPVQQLQQKQIAGVNDRYAKNAADITNLFGTLTTMREQDKVKINEQFVNTLVAQQEMLAGRTAEVRQSTQAGVDAAQKAESELGGPATGPVTSLTRQAAERGIAQSNALSTIWQNQMASQNMNTQAAIQNQIAGYGGQQANITKELGAKREGQLMQLEAQQTEIDQQIAQAKNDYNIAVANNNAAAARDAANRANAYAIAKMNNETDLTIAREKNQNNTTTYPANLTGWNSKVQAIGGDPRTVIDGIEGAREKVSAGSTLVKPSKAQIIAEWKKANPGWTAEDVAIVTEYLKYVP